VRLVVELPVELPHVDGLGVEDVRKHLIVAAPGQRSEAVLEDMIVAGLSAAAWADKHEPVADDDRVQQLDHLLDEGRLGLEVQDFARELDLV